MELNWIARFSASCLHMAEVVARDGLTADKHMAEVVRSPAQRLEEAIASRGLSRHDMWNQLIAAAINAGDPLYDPQVLGDRDLDGFPRVLFEQVDLGAYEFGPFAWAECIAGPDSRAPTPTCTVLDADRDGDVDLIDLAEFEASLGN